MKALRISVQVDAPSREEAVAFFKERIADLEKSNWQDTWFAGGGRSDAPFYTVSIGRRPLTIEERLERIEQQLTADARQRRLSAI